MGRGCPRRCYHHRVTAPPIRITVGGKHALTVEQAAERYGLSASGMRSALWRLGLFQQPDAMLDSRKPLFLASRLDRAMDDRPGKGSPGQPRPHKPPKEQS